MAVIVTEAAPLAPPGRRRLVALAQAAGTGLYVAAAVAAIPALWVGLVVLGQTLAILNGDDAGGPLAAVSNGPRAALFAGWAASVALFLGGRAAGRRLLLVGRRQVLFLRRFEYTAAAQVVTFAAALIGRHTRYVTCDDARVEPVGVDPATLAAARAWRSASRAASFAVTLYKAGVIALVVVAVVAAVAAGRATALLGIGLSVLCGGTLVTAIIVVGTLQPAFSFFGSAMRGAGEAERAKRIHVANARQAEEAHRTVRSLARRRFGTRLVVAKVAMPVWRATVTGFAVDADAALIDVSDPSQHLLWEIELMTIRVPRPCVFVAERARAAALFAGDPANEEIDGLRRLLDGHRVLTYTTDPAGARAFSEALRASLDRATEPAAGPTYTLSAAPTDSAAAAALTRLARPDTGDGWVHPQDGGRLEAGESLLFTFDAVRLHERCDDEVAWDLPAAVRVQVTDQRIIWAAAGPAGPAVAGQLRHMWITIAVGGRRRFGRGAEPFVELWARSNDDPAVRHVVRLDLAPATRHPIERIVAVAAARAARVWTDALPVEHAFHTAVAKPSGAFAWKGRRGVATVAVPLAVGVRPAALPEDHPDRLIQWATPSAPPTPVRHGYC